MTKSPKKASSTTNAAAATATVPATTTPVTAKPATTPVTTKSSPSTSPSTPSKAIMTPGELTFAIFFGTMMTTLAVLPLSLLDSITHSHDYHLFLSYLSWKTKPAFFWPFQMFLLVMTPIFLFGQIVDVVGIFTKKASRTRHFIDFITPIGTIATLYLAFGIFLPLESHTRETLLPHLHKLTPQHVDEIRGSITSLEWAYQLNAVINVILLILPMWRYRVDQRAAASSAPTVAVKGKTE